jgi:hypothetical protein
MAQFLTDDFSFFAFVDDPFSPDGLRRLALTKKLQSELTTLFVELSGPFFRSDLEELSFDGGYTPDDGQIFTLDSFPLPEHIEHAAKNPHAVSQLTKQEIDEFRVRGIVAARISKKLPEVYYQTLDRSAVISKERTLLLGEQFHRLTDSGLALGASLCAILRSGVLRFFSYNVAKRVVDLTSYFREATDIEIKEVLQSDVFAPCDLSVAAAGCNSWMRRRFSLLRASGILTKVKPLEVQKIAKRYDVPVALKGSRIIFPEDRKSARRLLQFLSEEYYDGLITGAPFVANSKRSVKLA